MSMQGLEIRDHASCLAVDQESPSSSDRAASKSIFLSGGTTRETGGEDRVEVEGDNGGYDVHNARIEPAKLKRKRIVP